MTGSARRTALQIANLAGLVAMTTINALANALPLGGTTTGAVSNSYPNLYVPAGLTFSIWGLIYLLLSAFAIYQARDLFRREKLLMSFQGAIGGLFLLSCAANLGWLFAWHYRLIALSVLAMVVLLATLGRIYVRLQVRLDPPMMSWDRYLVLLPFSVYFGWITVATIANVTALLVSLGWRGEPFGETFWAVVMIVLGAVIAAAVARPRRDFAYAAVVAWAYLGILLKRIDAGGPAFVAVAAGLCGAALLAATALAPRPEGR
jgi:hypothetical protein